MMNRPLKIFWCIALTAVALCGSGVIVAVVPQSVPTANKRGNSTRFQLADAGSTTTGNCTKFDANGNTADAGGPCTVGGFVEHTITFSLNGGGGVIPTGDQGVFPPANWSCEITGAKITAHESGSISIDIWRRSSAIPSAANKISGSDPITLSSSQLNLAPSIASWSTTTASTDVFGAFVSTVSSITSATVTIYCRQ